MSETEINKYQTGKVYKILNTLNNEVYVGSTYQKLSQRMTKHRNSVKDPHRNKNTFYTYIDTIGIEHFYIELIENFPCANKEELRAREGYWIRQIGTLNDKIAGRTPQQHYDDNKEKILERCKEHYENNKEEIQQRKKKYREENKEKIAEHKKQYYEENIDKIKEYKQNWHQQNREAVIEKAKKWNEEHREEKLEYYKQRYQNKKDEITQKNKEYREKNKELIAERKKEYYEANKEKFKAQQNEKIMCQCGVFYTKTNKCKHIKTKQHQAYEESITTS
jgi:DNA repair exonuclease SbcCD ATPase subunit